MTDQPRAEVIAAHTEACDDGRCPCYVQAQLDLTAALRTMHKLHYSLADVLAVFDDKEASRV